MTDTMTTAERIENACFTEVDAFGETSVVVEFWKLSGSILRTAYYPRTTATTYTFIPVDSWEYRKLENYAAPSFEI